MQRLLPKIKNFLKNQKFYLTISERYIIIAPVDADVAHLVERHLAKVEVASSSLVIRSIADLESAFFISHRLIFGKEPCYDLQIQDQRRLCKPHRA